MLQFSKRIGSAFAALALALTASAAHGQQSTIREISVPFGPPTGGQGYTGGSIKVRYAFLRCDDAIFIAYGLVDGSAQASSTYLMNGKSIEARGAPPQPSTIRFSATAQRAGAETIKSFVDGATGSALGFGCFSGQLQELGKTVAWLGPKPTPAQITNFLESLTLKVDPAAPLRNASLEAQVSAEQRQAQAKAAEDQHAKAEAEAKKQAEAKQAETAEAKKLADAKQAEQANKVAAATPSSRAASPAPSRPAPPPVLTDAQRADRAIEADRLLAQQRLAQQQEQLQRFNQQMANNEALARQQQQAVIGAAPQLAQLGAGLQAWSDGIMERKRVREFNEARLAQAGKCVLSNGLASPKNGDLKFGVPMSSKLTKADCGDRPGNRWQAFKLEIAADTLVQFTLTSGWGVHVGKYGLVVRDLDRNPLMSIQFDDYGAIQKTFARSVRLKPGVYVVIVENGYEDDYLGFEIRADAIGPNGRIVAAVPPPPAPTPASPAIPAPKSTGTSQTLLSAVGGIAGGVRPAPITPSTPVVIPTDASGSLAPNRLGASLETVDGKLLVRTLDTEGPLARAGLLPGDRILKFNWSTPAFDAAASPDPSAAVEAWLKGQPLGSFFMVNYDRAGAKRTTKWVNLRVKDEVGFTVEGAGGVLILKTVDPAGPAAKAGLQVGDQLTAIKAENSGMTFDHAVLTDARAFEAWLTRQRPGVPAVVEYRRGGIDKKAIVQMIAKPYIPDAALAAR